MAPMVNPGVPVYKRTRMPAHLRSYRQLKAVGLRPGNATRPDGAWKVQQQDQTVWQWLYDIRQARPYICTTKHALSATGTNR